MAFDFDSTMWDMMTALALEVERETGMPAAEAYAIVNSHWDAIDKVAGDKRNLLIRRSCSIEAMRPMGLYPGVVEATHELERLGYRIVVMTHRPPETITDVALMLSENEAVVHEIQCGEFDKIAACQAAGIDVLVDDKPATIEAAHAAGMIALSLSHPFNSEVIGRLGIVGASGWQPELIGQVIAALERGVRKAA